MKELTYEYDPDNLRTGELIGNGEKKRFVLFATKINEGGDGVYPVWVAITSNSEEYHKYAVQNVVGRPEGWYACIGDYIHDMDQAMDIYIRRGGQI